MNATGVGLEYSVQITDTNEDDGDLTAVKVDLAVRSQVGRWPFVGDICSYAARIEVQKVREVTDKSYIHGVTPVACLSAK